jgi:hypothetical protein
MSDDPSLQGYFELATESGIVALRCSWPFDVDADEWIHIDNLYDASDYSNAISDVAARGKMMGKAYGINGGFLEVAQADAGFLIEFSRPHRGWCANSLQLHIRRPIDELSLQALPFKVVHGRMARNDCQLPAGS